jgi:hypothetical protein
VRGSAGLRTASQAVAEGAADPYSAAEGILASLLRAPSANPGQPT